MKTDIEIALAGPADDPELRRLLRENPVPGPVSISYEREPDYFLAASVEGDPSQTIVGRDGDRVVGLGSRSIHTAYVDGEPRPIGYLGQLRLDRGFRGRAHLLFQGYDLFRELHRGSGPPFYLTSLVDGNRAAERILASGHPRLPRYRFFDSFKVLALKVRAARPSRVRPARAEDLPDIVDVLRRFGSRHQLCRRWTAEELLRARGLSVEDFLLGVSGGRMVGCSALWDQSGFKQAVVRGYSSLLRLLRPVLGLPELGEPLRMAYLSHVAVVDDDPGVLVELIRGTMVRARERGIRYLVLGLAERNPMLPAVRELFDPIEYGTSLYRVSWEAAPDPDSRPCHVEVATL
jgi:hypothetical protein